MGIGRRTGDGWWSKAYRDEGAEVLMQHTTDAFYTTDYEWLPIGIARNRLNEGVVVGGCGGSINWGLRAEDLVPRKGCGSFGPTSPDRSRTTKVRRVGGITKEPRSEKRQGRTSLDGPSGFGSR